MLSPSIRRVSFECRPFDSHSESWLSGIAEVSLEMSPVSKQKLGHFVDHVRPGEGLLKSQAGKARGCDK